MIPTTQSPSLGLQGPSQIQPCSLSSHNQLQVVSRRPHTHSVLLLPGAPYCLLPADSHIFLPLGGQSGHQGGLSGSTAQPRCPPPPAPVLSGGPPAALCLSQGAELLKGSSVSFMATARCQAQASLGINSQEYSSNWITWKPVSDLRFLVPHLLPSLPLLPSQQGPLTRPPGTWHR